MQREHYVIRNEIPICGIQPTAFECNDNETSMQTTKQQKQQKTKTEIKISVFSFEVLFY